MRKTLMGLLALVLAGCAYSQDLSPEQAFYDAEGVYRSALIVATGYKAQCENRPETFETDCEEIVERIQAYDLMVQEARQKAREIVFGGDDGVESVAVEAFVDATNSFNGFLTDITNDEEDA